MDAWIQEIGGRFGPDQYLFWTRIQCLLWTGADFVIVFHLLRIANLARALLGRRTHFISYIVLFATLPLAPFVLVAPTGGLIFLIELLVTVPHFLLILYVIAANVRVFPLAANRLFGAR